jgi:ABC-2 type transport system ATP-binding protein
MENDLISVSVENVCKKMLKTQALSDVKLRFEEGVIHGIIGPNGAGKTTLIRLMVSLLKADCGKIEYFYGNAKREFKEIKRETAYFPQEQSLYSDISCMEHMKFFADLYNIPKEVFKKRAQELLDMTNLKNFYDAKAGELSGGMYKKLGLACVLLNRPKLLFLDEPTIGVDPLSRRELWDLMYKLSQDKMTIILSTSYMDEAERCAKVHLLDEGRVRASGTPQEVLARFGAKSFVEIFRG